MTQQEIFNNLIPVIAASLNRPDSEVVLSARFADDLGADSLDVVQLSVDVENKFDIRFTDKEIETISTVQDLVKLIEKSLSAVK